MKTSLQDFIKSVRFAENPDDEKFIISNEEADIRNYIRSNDSQCHPLIVSKLLFLGTIGENVAYGQMEVLSLMSSEAFSYKRIGYISAPVVLDETSEIAVLITQTVFKDLRSDDKMVKSLALNLVANMGFQEMCATVGTEVFRLIEGKDEFIIKKAIMAALKVVKMMPEFIDNVLVLLPKIFTHYSHGVIISGLNLMIELLNEKNVSPYKKYANTFLRLLKQMQSSILSKEYSFNYFNDPFLQSKLLKVLVLLNVRSQELDDLMQMIVTGVDIQKNTGRSLLLQVVETIVFIANDSSLRGLALSQVGRLLQLNEPNILYIALSAFSRVLYQGSEIIGRTSNDSIALQRYKSQIVNCLNHKDPSIRRRALNVISALIDETNAETLIPEVLDYVKMADSEFRVELVAKIFTAIQRFGPDEKWNFDAVYRILVEDGNYVENDIITSFCKLISNSPQLQNEAIKLLSSSLLQYSDNQTLIQVSSWIIGEFIQDDDGTIENLKKIIAMPQTTNLTKGYIITALSKMAVRFNKVKEIREFISFFIKLSDLDVQQRAGEMYNILNEKEIAEEVLSPTVKQNLNSSINQENNDDLLNIISEPYTDDKQKDNNDLLSITSLVSDKISPPKGAIEALRMPDYVIYFEMIKNPKNEKQIAIRASIFNLNNTPLTNFTIKYGVPNGWHLQVQQATSTTLESIGGEPIFQQLMLTAQDDTPLKMKTKISYMYHTQPISEECNINPIFSS